MIVREDLTIARLAPDAHLLLHCAPEDAAALGGAGGVTLGSDMLRAISSGSWDALHLAPDEWLLVGPTGEAEALAERLAASAVVQSLVDVGERSLALAIEGPSATMLLAAGCPLDLGEAAFPVGACTRTLFGKSSVMLWRLAHHRFRLEYARSFDGYVTGLLSLAAHDVGQLRDPS